MKYKNKPIIIEAFHLTENTIIPEWFKSKMNDGTIIKDKSEKQPCFIISTLEGEMKAILGDYIIKGVNGEIYPCKENIFNKTYEKVEEK